jgi:hypothetical protein
MQRCVIAWTQKADPARKSTQCPHVFFRHLTVITSANIIDSHFDASNYLKVVVVNGQFRKVVTFLIGRLKKSTAKKTTTNNTKKTTKLTTKQNKQQTPTTTTTNTQTKQQINTQTKQIFVQQIKYLCT